VEGLGFDSDTAHWIEVAVREAVANAIKHGNRLDVEKKVEIAVSVDQGNLTIEVRDQGQGFELVELGDPLDPTNLMKPSGRGILYMRRFMDQVDYRRGEPQGTVLTLRKRVPPGAATI
ncbi:MAG TPA: ATP-binding protein, partial [Thermoanaerobaculia bacterium]|nr:ATP-binding protein [Thermoanaerobaculia bacterium]